MKCTDCQTETEGAFCPACGAPASGATCKACSSGLLAGARYCTDCGTPVRASNSQAPWFIAGVSLVGLLAVLLATGLRPGGNNARDTGLAASMGNPPPGLDGRAAPLTGTPREQADRLFNRVMQALEQGDHDQASFFLPMGVLAYRQAGDLDNDGLYHLSLLETASGDPESGLKTAEELLQRHPDHLLALGAAAQAAVALDDQATARRHYERFLEVLPTEKERSLVEYIEHAPIFDAYDTEAREFLQR